MVYKTLHRQLKIEQHEHDGGELRCSRTVPSRLVALDHVFLLVVYTLKTVSYTLLPSVPHLYSVCSTISATVVNGNFCLLIANVAVRFPL